MSPKYYLPDGSTPTYEAIQQRPWMETVLPRLLERALQEPTIGDAIDFVNRSNC